MEIGLDSFVAIQSDPTTGETLTPSARLRDLLE
jgi:hypothetical protein